LTSLAQAQAAKTDLLIAQTHKPVIFQEACRQARELAKMHRSDTIILVPNR
jgi:hypothetical protein